MIGYVPQETLLLHDTIRNNITLGDADLGEKDAEDAMRASGVAFDLENRTMRGDNGVSGAVPAGAFTADRMRAALDTRTITLDGNARLTMVPGELRVP